jgi:dihydroorotase
MAKDDRWQITYIMPVLTYPITTDVFESTLSRMITEIYSGKSKFLPVMSVSSLYAFPLARGKKP